jgi:hypothetical protein
MLGTPDYLRVKKRRTECSACGHSLVEAERIPSILLDPKEPGVAPGPEATPSSETPLEETANVASETGTETPPPAPDAPAPQPSEASTAKRESRGKKDTRASEKEPAPEEAEEESFLRLDYCEACWQELKDRAFFSFWVSKRTTTDLPRKKLSKTERNLALVALFDSLSERDDSEVDFTPHLFFLAHLLMKFKIFKWVVTKPDPKTGDLVIHFARTDSEEEVLVADMDMPPEMVVRIKEEIESYLSESTGQPVRL